MNTLRTRLAVLPLLIFGAAMLLSGCVSYEYDLKEVLYARKAKKTMVPENQWNATRIWRRVSDSPATYIPVGYATGAPRSASHGTWFVDERDGKRFFVPKGGVSGVSEAILRNDAVKNSNPFRARAKVTRW